MSRYIPATAEDRRRMLDYLGVGSIDDLFSGIPEKVRQKKPSDLPPALTEPEMVRDLKRLSGSNRHTGEMVCFLGAGAYDHFIPAAVDSLVSRGEFTTSYTPYQPEVAQGTLQAIFQYQTMVCELTGMESRTPPCTTVLRRGGGCGAGGHGHKRKKILWGFGQPQTRKCLNLLLEQAARTRELKTRRKD